MSYIDAQVSVGAVAELQGVSRIRPVYKSIDGGRL